MAIDTSTIEQINVQGTLDLPSVTGISPDESSIYRIACAQVLPSENGITGKGGLDKLEAYTKEAAKRGADGE